MPKVTLMEFSIRVEFGVLYVEEEHEVLKQPPRSQAPYMVGRALFMMEYSFVFLKDRYLIAKIS